MVKRQTSSPSAQAETTPLQTLAQSVLKRLGGGRRGLSPWLQRQITKKTGRPAQLSLTGGRVSALLQRLERHATRATMWQPQTSSLNPALVSRFTQNIIRRVTALQPEPKYQTRPSDMWAKPPTELTLAGAAAAEPPIETPAPTAFPFTVDQVREAMERQKAGLPPVTPEKPAAMPTSPPPVQRQPALPFSVAEVRAALEQPQFTRAPEIKPPAAPTQPTPPARPRRWVQEVTETGPNEAPESTVGADLTPKAPTLQRQTLPPPPAHEHVRPQTPLPQSPSAPTSTPPLPRGEKPREEAAWLDLDIPTPPEKPVIQRQPSATPPLSQPETFTPANELALVKPRRPRPIVHPLTPPVAAVQKEAESTPPAVAVQREEKPAPPVVNVEPPVQRQPAPDLPLRPPAPHQAEQPASLAPEQIEAALPPVTPSPRPTPPSQEATAPARPVTSIEPPLQRQLVADLPLRPPAPHQAEETAPLLAPEEIKASPPPVTPSPKPTPPPVTPSPRPTSPPVTPSPRPTSPPQEATAPARLVTTIEPPVQRVSEMPLRPPALRQAEEPAPVEVEQAAPPVISPAPPAPPAQTIAPVQVAPQMPPPLQRQPAPDLPLRPPAPRQAEEPAPVKVEQAAPPVIPPAPPAPPAQEMTAPAQIAPPIPPPVQRQPVAEMPLRPPAPRQAEEPAPVEVEQAAPPVAPTQKIPPPALPVEPPGVQRQPASEMPLRPPAPHPLTEVSPQAVEQTAPPVTPSSRPTILPQAVTPAQTAPLLPPPIQRQPAPEMPLSRPVPRQEPPPAKTVDLGTTLQAKAEKVASLPLISPRPGQPPRSKPVEQMAVLPQAREFRDSTNIQKKGIEPPARKVPLPFRPQAGSEQRPALPLAIPRLTESAGAAAEPAPARPITPAPLIIQRYAAAEPTAPIISTTPTAVVQRVEEQTLVAAASPPGEETAPNLDDLARQVYPLIKQMLAVERERRPFR